jgi:hypothetical protein
MGTFQKVTRALDQNKRLRVSWPNHCSHPMYSIDYYKGIFSFATATAPGVSTRTLRERLRRMIPLKQKISRRMRKPRKETGQNIPTHTHVFRGWDHTNLEWQKVVWPKLDCKLQPLQGESTVAWRLDWRGDEKVKDVIVEEPQGSSSTGHGREMGNRESSEVVVKLGKGKGRSVIREA